MPCIPCVKKRVYTIEVKTGNVDNAGTNGPVYLTLFGNANQNTKENILKRDSSKHSSFEKGSTKTIQLEVQDVGKPERINVRLDDKATGWFLEYIKISTKEFSVNFFAYRWLNAMKCDRKLSIDLIGTEKPAAVYNFYLLTGSEQSEPLDSPVYVQLFGTTAQTQKLFLEPKGTPFSTDSIEQFEVVSRDVGEIQKIVVGHEGTGKINDWHLKTIRLQVNERKQKFTVNKWLSPVKGDQNLFVALACETASTEMYSVKVQTGDVEQNIPSEKVHITIHGSNGQTDKIRLKDFVVSKKKNIFQQGSSDEFEFVDDNIGEIEKLTIGFDDENNQFTWLLEYVEIKCNDRFYHFEGECWLSTRLGPEYSWVTLEPDTTENYTTYRVFIESGESNINSNVMACISGNQGRTRVFALRTLYGGEKAVFETGSFIEFEVKDIDVGRIDKMNVGHDGKGDEQKWTLNSGEIEKNDEFYLFKAYQLLSEGSVNFIDLKIIYLDRTFIGGGFTGRGEAAKPTYKVTVRTSSEVNSETDANVRMIIFGKNNRTERFPLRGSRPDGKPLFQPGNKDKFDAYQTIVQDIEAVYIEIDRKARKPSWHLDSVQLQQGSNIYDFPADIVLDLAKPGVHLKLASPRKRVQQRRQKAAEEPKVPEPTLPIKETIYKVLVRRGVLKHGSDDDDEGDAYITIFGVDGVTGKMPLKKNENGEIEFKTRDVGKIQKIIIGQDATVNAAIFYVDHVIIQHGDETTTII